MGPERFALWLTHNHAEISHSQSPKGLFVLVDHAKMWPRMKQVEGKRCVRFRLVENRTRPVSAIFHLWGPIFVPDLVEIGQE